MKKSGLISFCLLIIAISIVACGGSGKKATYKIKNASFNLEAPLFSGANTAQAEHKIDLAAIKKELSINASEVKSAKLIKAVIYFQDSTSTDIANSIVLSLAADKVKMAEVGVINPLEAGKKEVNLQGSTEAEIADFFNQSLMYLVLDIDLKADAEKSLILSADLEFELEF